MPIQDDINSEVLALEDRVNPVNGNPVVLKKRKDFVAASKSGHKAVASSIIIQMNPKPVYGLHDLAKRSELRYGLTASKKTGNAVCRNRSKRRMRVLIAEYLAEFGSVGCDYVLIARHNTATVPYTQLVKDFKYVLRKVHQPFKGRAYVNKDNTKNVGKRAT